MGTVCQCGYDAREAGALLSHNVFSYCRNNPVVKSDPNGQMEGVAAGLLGTNPLLGIAAAMVMALVYAAKQITKNKTSGMPKSQSRSAENVASQQGYITATIVDEATDVLRNNPDGDKYWLASVNPEKGMILIGPPVSAEIAERVVLSGKEGADIFAINASAAYDLAYDAAMEIGGRA